jgi:nicotinic acid mononucleotide adenylyltransferase
MEQKELALDFFFELLAHRDDDIRYHAANRIGDLLSLGEDFWRKDLPAGVTVDGGNWVLAQLGRVFGLLDMAGPEAEDDMSPTERLVYALPVVLRRLVTHADPDLARSVLTACFDHFLGRLGDHRPLVGLYVCEASEVLLHLMSHEQQLGLLELAQGWAHHEVDSTRLMAWRLLAGLAHAAADNEALRPGLRYCVDLLGRRVGPRMLVAEAFLLEQVASRCGLSRVVDRCRDWLSRQSDPVQQVMLRNLKARVGWVEKKVNCDFLVATALARRDGDRDVESHFANELAFHFANLLKVSRVEGTRFHAGRCLLQLAPALTVAQRNDLMVELLRSLQLDVEAVTRYIPRFLGSLLATLPQLEFAEALDDIETNARSGGELPQRLLLQTAGWIVITLDHERLDERVLRRILGVMLAGLAETRAATAHEAFAQVSMVLDRLRRAPAGDDRACRFLVLATKKLLTLVSHRGGDRGRFFLIASMLNHLERALAAARGRVHFPERPTVAFIPGTFDPFTMAHSQVVSRALEHADEALVQVDDYSWRKHAQPRERRKELAWMALASIPEAFPSPIEPPVNIANPASLAALGRRIGHRSLLLVAGTDVLAGASAYRSPGSKIWDLPHLVVMREEFTGRKWQEKLGWFRAGVQVARVAPGMRTVSSSTLRGALSRQETLEQYSDPLVARTLSERQLYVNFPSQKELVPPPDYLLETRRGRVVIPPSLHQLVRVEAPASAAWARLRREACVLRQHGATNPVAAITWREVAAAELPVVLSDQRLARLPEGQLFGLGALIDGLAVDPEAAAAPVLQALLAKVIARFLDAGLLFAVTALPASAHGALWVELEQCGAQMLTPPDTLADRPGWVGVDLGDPLVLLWDMEETLQPRFAAQPETRRVTEQGRRSIAEFFARRAPGHGLLHVSEQQVKREIAMLATSRLAAEQRNWVVLGLGRRFSRDLIGERPTLAVELERFLTWEGYEAGVQPSPGSPALALQLDTARELGRDALLLAPFLDTADAVQQVVAQAKVAGIKVREVLIGVTSATVHATLHLDGIPHRCGVVVPRWRGVVRESCLAPYLGGWSIQGRAPLQTGSLLPSLNDCLPYHHPHPLGLGGESALDFSRLVLDHTRNLLATLEELFREAEGRFLSLREMRAIVRTPRCPPFSLGIEPPRGRLPSSLLAEDLESLARLHPESHAAHRARWRSG